VLRWERPVTLTALPGGVFQDRAFRGLAARGFGAFEGLGGLTVGVASAAPQWHDVSRRRYARVMAANCCFASRTTFVVVGCRLKPHTRMVGRRPFWRRKREVFVNERLRDALASAGMSTQRLAEAIGVDIKTPGRWVNEGRIPHPRHRVAAAKVLGREPAELFPVRRRDTSWFRPWREIEREATVLRWFELAMVPGLLQTEAYARMLLISAAKATRDEVEKAVVSRLERQRILARAHPPQLTVVMDEWALRRSVGDAEVMREQLRHLVEASAAPNIRIHIVPAISGFYAGMDGPFVLASAPGKRVAGYVDHQASGQPIESEEDVARLLAAWESCLAEAMTHRQSREMIEEWSQTWTWT
jgi:transcriptional regulator with XRE-family HTH domain